MAMRNLFSVRILEPFYVYIRSNYSDLTRPHPKWWFSKGNPLISGKSRLVKYYNLVYVYMICMYGPFFFGGDVMV